ncbi:MAG: preprotein translocase subunit YajC [Peptoniphilaceae bacterium]|nr:preprotein translocase subunit YajC [Peptoniphilaceae bacterium]MDD7383448.1 preprotein translocase subunit YajC [Peptoniphilaceae bacterium]MDY3738488.1 preprotein translocase subunit YajC [Peptoniphilaceae bacterium]
MNIRIEYLILFLLILAFYFLIANDEIKNKKRKKEISKVIKNGDKIILDDGIIAKVVEVYHPICLCSSGKEDKISYFEVKIENIKYIV